MAVEWGRRVWNYPTNHETTSMRTQTKPGRRGQMSFPFQGSETGQHRPPKRKEIRKFVNMFCYNHPKNMDHKKHCNEGKIMLAVKKIFLFFKEANTALCKVLHKGIT